MHRHNYFELIYVLDGRGIHVINENQFAYGKSDLFLLTPGDVHTFMAHDQSQFCIIDFTSAFFDHKMPFNKTEPEQSYFLGSWNTCFKMVYNLTDFLS